MTTILQPRKNSLKINWLLLLITSGLLLTVFQGIFFYNQIVNLQHSVSVQKKFLTDNQALNTDLKNNVYQLTDFKNLVGLVNQLGLVKVNKPEFIQLEKPVAVKL